MKRVTPGMQFPLPQFSDFAESRLMSSNIRNVMTSGICANTLTDENYRKSNADICNLDKLITLEIVYSFEKNRCSSIRLGNVFTMSRKACDD